MSSIQTSREYLINRTGYEIDDSTFQVLNEEQCVWVARVTTTHNKKAYEDALKRQEELGPGLKLNLGSPDEVSFTVLVRHYEHFRLGDSCLPALTDWCLKQAK